MNEYRTKSMTTRAQQLSGKWFKDVDPKSFSRLLSTVSDVALVVDKNGVIRDLATQSSVFKAEDVNDWVGSRWADTVTTESKTKVEELIKAASGNAPKKWRQVNHPSLKSTIDIPVEYCAYALGQQDRILAFGKELSSASKLQQRLVASQQTAEQDYSRLKLTETRYRALFQMSTEAVVIVDADSLKISELNPSAAKLIGGNANRVLNRSILDIIKEKSRPSFEKLIQEAQNSPESKQKTVELAKGKKKCIANVSLFRQERGSFLLIRLMSADGAENLRSSDEEFLEIVGLLPDGFVVTDEHRRILLANKAFVDLTELATEDQVKGQYVDRWLGGSRIDADLLFANMREYGSVHRFATVIEGELGSQRDIEISAVAIESTEEPRFGLSMRTVPQRSVKASHIEKSLPRSVQQMTELVGRVPLKDLIRDTTDIIERLCIEAALELTDDNRASAAEILGLSRQSLYVKLRRYGIIDSDQPNLS